MILIIVLIVTTAILWVLIKLSPLSLMKELTLSLNAGSLHVSFGMNDVLLILITWAIVLAVLKVFKPRTNEKEKTFFVTVSIILLVLTLVKIYPLLPGK